MRKSVLVALGATLLLLLAAAGEASSRKSQPAVTGVAFHADLDGDKVFQELEAKLAATAGSARVSVIVRLRGPASRARLRALEARVGELDVTHRFRRVHGFAARVTAAQARALAATQSVRHLESNGKVHTMNDSAQQSFGVTTARAQDASLDGNCEEAGNPVCADSVYGASDLVAAVIDTGIDAGHVDLDGGKVIGFANCVGTGPCAETGAFDDEGHGTHVAATVAGDGDASGGKHKGVAPRAALVGVKVLNAQGSGTDADVIEGIEWATANRARFGIEAINLSLGSSGCSNGSDATSAAVNNAAAAGLVVVVAAGNDGPGTCTVGSPGSAAGALTVGAMADLGENGFHQASFSSRGLTQDGRRKPEVSAPGVNVTSAKANSVNQYAVASGTSMATPFVAGTALLMLDANPAVDVKCTVMATAVDWGRASDNGTSGCSSTVDREYGAGRLDAHAALKAAGAPLGNGPAVPTHEVKEGTLSGTGAVKDYPLNVTSTEFPIAATLIIPGISGAWAYSPDFDLYLYSPSGTLLKAVESVYRQEELGYNPAPSAGGAGTGTYTLRVRSYSGSGAYFVDVSAPTAPAPPAPPPPPAPQPVTAHPATTTIESGSFRSGSAASLTAADSAYYAVNSTTRSTYTSQWYGSFTGVAPTLSNLVVHYQGKHSRTVTQRIYVYRWTTGSWVQLNSTSVGTTERSYSLAPSGAPSDYVSSAGEVRVRVRGTTSNGSFFTSANLLRLTYDA